MQRVWGEPPIRFHHSDGGSAIYCCSLLHGYSLLILGWLVNCSSLTSGSLLGRTICQPSRDSLKVYESNSQTLRCAMAILLASTVTVSSRNAAAIVRVVRCLSLGLSRAYFRGLSLQPCPMDPPLTFGQLIGASYDSLPMVGHRQQH